MKDMVIYAPIYRAYADWKKVQAAMKDPAQFLPIAKRLLDSYDRLAATYKDARAIVDAHPGSDGAQVLREMLEMGEEQKVLAPAFLPALKKDVRALAKKHGDGQSGLRQIVASALLSDKTRIAAVEYPARSVKMTPIVHDRENGFEDIRPRYEGKPKDGLVYARGFSTARHAGAGKLRIGADGPFKVFVNRKQVACNPKATNPISSQVQTVDVTWKRGKNEVVLAMRTNGGKAWGFMASMPKE